MSTSKTYQQSLANASFETRPPMLERVVIYHRQIFTPEGSSIPRLQTVEDLEGNDLLLHDAEIEVMNMILLSIPNEIYNSVDACTSAKDINNMNFPTVTINTKFLNSLQPEWLKYETQVRIAKQLTVDSFDDLFYYLQQFEKLVNASREKKLEKSHDPLALVAHMGSSSRHTSSYYVTHPMSVVDYDDEYQQDDVHNNSEDPLASAMLLLAKYITQNFSNLTNNRRRASSNTRNQAIIQGDRVNIQSRNSGNTRRNSRRAYVQEEVVKGMNAPNETGNVQRTLHNPSSGNNSTVQCYNCSGKGHYARNYPKLRVCDSKIQPADHTSDDGPSYESAFISEEAEKQQIFAQQVHKQNTYFTSQLEMYKERVWILENINKDNNYLNEFLEADERAKHYHKQAQSQLKNKELQKTHSILKRQMIEKEDTYHDTILDLEAKLKKNVDLILKLGNSLQGMFMLGPKPLSVYDQQLKHGLGYPNPYTLKQAISECPKLYVASSLGNIEIPLNVRDIKDTLEDAFKSQQKTKEKMNDPITVANKKNCWTINYKKLNTLYEDFVPQKELSAEQNYFPSSSIPSVKISVKPILNELKVYLDFFQNLFQRDIKEMKDVFESTESELDELEKQNDLLKDQLLEASLKHDVELCVLIKHECVAKSLHAEIEQIKKKSIEIQEGLQARIKILEKDVQRCEKQIVDFQLKLQHEKEKEKWDSTSKNKTTIPLDYSWISKMEKLEDENVSLDFKVQSLIKERDNVKMEYKKLFDSIKKTRSQTQKEMDELIAHVSEKTYAYGAVRAENRNLLSTISELTTRMKHGENGKSVNTKFDKTNGSQSLLCVTPLNKHAFQKKTNVLKIEENHVASKPVTLQTLPTKQTGANQNTNVIRPMRRDSHVAHSVLDNSKKAVKNVAVYVRKNKQRDNTSANVISNKENVIEVDVANASKEKTLLCVSCMQNVLIPCHDKCLAKIKLNVCSNVHRTFFTNSRTSKSSETTFVAPKTRFSEKETQSKTLDTMSVVSKSKIDVESASKAKYMVVQIVLWVVDSGCSKHMTGDRSLLRNFIKKFMGTVRFGNDNFVAITGYGDYYPCNIQFVIIILNDNAHTSGRDSNLYTISISNMAASSPVCLMSRATSTKSWLWHRRLSHLNFGTINDLTRLDLVDGLPKFKYRKDHLCSAYEKGKSKKDFHPPKLVPSDYSKLELHHINLCGLMRVASINGKKYILVIVDDFSRYTWV
ncbi:retrovirus-related pol polyprotein from transposon TNT 1-94 [Tanacetum coccineum]